MIGARMQQVVDLVRMNPGQSMVWYARRVGPNGSTRYGYRTCWRAVRAGLVQTAPGRNGGRTLWLAA